MLVYIKPKSSFPELHSDTLFGAIISSMSDLYHQSIIDNLFQEFNNNNPPFIISSAFPFITIKNNKKRFYPMIKLNSKLNVDNRDVFKDFKKVKYIEESLFFALLNGKITLDRVLNKYDEYTRINNLLIKGKHNLSFYFKNSIVPNNRVNRLDNSTKIFYNEGMKFNENCGVFFFIDIINDKYLSIIKSVFRLLKDRGFGRDISTGKGQFDYEIENINIEEIFKSRDNPNKFVTLSRFIPNKTDLDCIKNGSTNYELGFKRGITRNGYPKKQVRFFTEGSTFPFYENNYGSIIESFEKSFEYGYAFPLKYYDGSEDNE